MSSRNNPTNDGAISLYLMSDERARRIAQKLADTLGKRICLKDATGKEVIVLPVPARPEDDRTTWRVGQIVSRKTSSDLGRIVAAAGDIIKVKWDHGKSSYYRAGVPGDVRLPPRRRSQIP